MIFEFGLKKTPKLCIKFINQPVSINKITEDKNVSQYLLSANTVGNFQQFH